jgi:hypothetical protein
VQSRELGSSTGMTEQIVRIRYCFGGWHPIGSIAIGRTGGILRPILPQIPEFSQPKASPFKWENPRGICGVGPLSIQTSLYETAKLPKISFGSCGVRRQDRIRGG